MCDSVAEAVEDGEESRSLIMSQLQSYMVQVFDRYDNKLKLQEMSINSRNKAVKKYVA